MAEEGIIFTDAYANAPNCAPSRAALMTGMYAPRHKIYTVGSAARGKEENRKMIPVENTVTLELEYVTLAEGLRQSGYTTGHFGKWHLGDTGFFPEDQGFDVNAGGHRRGSPPGGHFSPYKNPTLSDGPEGEYLTDRLTDEALAFIDQAGDQSFFLYLTHYAVHTPIQGKEELKDKYEKKATDGGQDNATYAAMIESVDESVGRVLDKLEAIGKTDNTLVIFYSDNGGAIQATSNEPLRGYKGMLYEGGIRVPMTVSWPGHIEPGLNTSTVTTFVDWFPTLANLLGQERPAAALDGIDFSSALLGTGDIEERSLILHFPIYLQAYNTRKDDGRDPLFRTRPGSIIRKGNWKLHEYFEDGALELYNLASDLGETNNVIKSNPKVAAELYAELKAGRTSIDATVPTEPNPKYDPVKAADFLMNALIKGGRGL